MNIVLKHNNVNLAHVTPHEHIHPLLTEHSKTFQQRIYSCCDRFYLCVGYSLANVCYVDCNDSFLVIDTTECVETAQQTYNDMKKVLGENIFERKPVKNIIYTHNHLDHTAGVRCFTSSEDVKNGKVQIIAHEKLMDEIRNNASVVSNIINKRGIYTFGLLLDSGPDGQVNQGLGPKFVTGTTTFIQPSLTFDKELKLIIGDMEVELYHIPSETNDQIFVYFPQYEVMQTADIVIESFPNLHTIRGCSFRSPVKWYESIDYLRKFKARFMLPSHNRPLEGISNIEDTLTAYRDAIQFIHDQTIKNINKGMSPDELVQVVNKLPKHLRSHPYLQEYYGKISHCVRQIYVGYLGFFESDPTFLNPLPPLERSKKYIKLMGGFERVFSRCEEYYKNSEYQWCAELCTHLIQVHPDSIRAKNLKANCLQKLAHKEYNTNWYNWYLTSALELRGCIDDEKINKMDGHDSIEIIKEIPLDCFLKILCVKIDPIKSENIHLHFAFIINEHKYCSRDKKRYSSIS